MTEEGALLICGDPNCPWCRPSPEEIEEYNRERVGHDPFACLADEGCKCRCPECPDHGRDSDQQERDSK